MMSVGARSPLVLFALLLSLTAPAGSRIEEEATSAVDAEVTRWLALATAGREGVLDAAVMKVMRDETRPVRVREAILYRFALQARALPVSNIPLAVLGELSEYESQVLVPHPESRGAVMVPLYDVSRIAAGTIRYARYERRVMQAHEALTRGPAAFWEQLDTGKVAPDARVLVAAIERTERHALLAGRDALAKAWKDRTGLGPVAAALALRLGDGALAQRVVREAEALSARRVVDAAPATFDDAAAMALLRTAAGRQALASSAVMAAGRMLDRSDEARRWLYHLLDDERLGASAATALARWGGDGAVRYAKTTLDAALPEPLIAHRLLLLRLADTAEARAFLAAIAADPALPDGLRREVEQWR